MLERIKRALLGAPLASHLETDERLNVPVALAVFASDALSSTAYATEEILIALVATVYAGSANLLSLPVALAIVTLLAIVVLSYRHVIRAYPEGGGSYHVARENLGAFLSQVAGAALLIDYILTVAVSISAGVAAFVSTGWVDEEWSVVLAFCFLALIMVVNLRGVKESGLAFAVPAYAFLVGMLGLLAVGFFRLIRGDDLPDAPVVAGQLNSMMDMALTLVLLKAFSHGCAALTGIEAISNGTQAFREPVARNANRTMVLMGAILATIFFGMTVLAFSFHVLPSPTGIPTVVSQIALAVFGEASVGFYYIQLITMVILILAANTSFAGFPRLASLLAHDGYLPRQLMSLGDRLVYSNGIVVLGALSGLLIWLYHADTHGLIPLYAVGVFLSFTIAQAGMVARQIRPSGASKPRPVALLINSIGAITTGVVTIILAVEKFTEGAWIVLVAIPLLILLFGAIDRHYKSIGRQLSLPVEGACPTPRGHVALVLVSSLNQGTVPALEYAKSISGKVEAVHVSINPEATERLKKNWDQWGCGIPLTVLHSPYRSIIQPLLDYVGDLEKRFADNWVTVVVPEFVTRGWWHALLHNHTSLLIKAMLHWHKDKGKIVSSVRYYLDE